MQLIKKLVVRIATPQRYLGTFVENIKDQVTFNKCLFFLSNTSFCCGLSL